MSLDLQLTRAKRIVKMTLPNHIVGKDALRAIVFVAQRITAHALKSAIEEARLKRKKIVGYEHLADAVLHANGLAFLRDTVPHPIQLNRSG